MKRLMALFILMVMLCSIAPIATASDIQLSYLDDTSPITFEMYIDYNWYTYDTWGKDDISKEITARTGVTLDVYKSSDLAELGVLLAADDLPELIFTSNLIARFEDEDVCYPWNRLAEQYAPGFFEWVNPLEKMNNTAADGNIYTFKTHFHYWESPLDFPSTGDDGLFLRTDILEKLGMKLEDITSVEELLDVFAKVDENKAELGIDVVYNPHPSWTNAIGEYMGIKTTQWIDDDGNAHTVWSDPAFKEYYLMLNDLFNKGLLYKDAYAVRPEDFFALNRSGKVFATTYNTGVATETNKIFDENGMEDYTFDSVKALTYKGEHVRKTYAAGVGWASTYITNNCKNPERAIKFMEFLKSPEGDALTQWGIEGKHYNLNDEGMVIMTQQYYDQIEADKTSVGRSAWYFQGSGLGEGTVIASKMSQTNATAQELEYQRPQYELLKYLKSTYVSVPYWYFARVSSDTDEYVTQTKLQTYWSTKTQEIIQAENSEKAAALYDEMMAYLYDNGLTELEAALTSNYQAKLPLYADYIATHPLNVQ